MARGYRPGSTRDGAHAAHLPAPIQTPAQRSPMSEAMADAALQNIYAVLAQHKSRLGQQRRS